MHHRLTCTEIGYREKSVGFIPAQTYLRGGYTNCSGILAHIELTRIAARLLHENFCRRLSYRIAENTPLIIAEEPENVLTIEIHRKAFAIGKR